MSRDRILDLLLALGLFALAAALRLGHLDAASADHDALAPFLRGALITTGRSLFPPAPFPESGWAMAWVQVPHLIGAGSLVQVLARRALATALMAPGAYALLRRQGRAGALLAGGALALSPGLIDTVLSGFKTFDVPLLCLLLSALVRSGRPAALALVLPMAPLLVMVHPHSVAIAPGIGLVALLAAREPVNRRPLLLGLGLALALTLPQLHRDLLASADHPGGLIGFVGDRTRAPERWDDLWGSLWTELRGEYGMAAGLCFLSLLRPGGDRHRALLRGSALSLGLVAARLRYLHAYHTRPLWVLAVVEAGAWVGALPGRVAWPLTAALLGGLALSPALPLPAVSDTVGRTDALTTALLTDLGPTPAARSLGLETLNLDPGRHALPEGPGLDLLLRGLPDEAWVKEPGDLARANFYVALTGTPAQLAAVEGPRPVWADETTRLLRFSGLSALQAWAGALCAAPPAGSAPRRGGATDWLAFVHGDAAAGAPETWMPGCD